MAIPYLTQAVSASAISSNTLGLASNPKRISWNIESVGTGAVFVNFGTAVPTPINYHIVLKGGSAINDGNGGSFGQSGDVCYTGQIMCSGTGAVYTIVEFAP